MIKATPNVNLEFFSQNVLCCAMKLFVKLFKHDTESFFLHDTQTKFVNTTPSFSKVIQWNLKQDFAPYLIEAIWCQVVNKLRALALGEKVAMSDGSWKQKPK